MSAKLEFREVGRGRALQARLDQALARGGRPVTVMHVCGSHEQAIARYGLRARFPRDLRVQMGPGCPVCVTDAPEIDACLALAEQGLRVLTYGDMLRVPGRARSLDDARAAGARVDVIYAATQAAEIARASDEPVVFFATGFETTDWHWSLDVYGRGGMHLSDVWKDGPQAYLGLLTAGFPNMFMLYGPNTNLAHNSITFMIERQVEYMVKTLAATRAQNASSVTVRDDAQARFNAALQAQLAKTVWADPHCASWYKNAAGRITQNWGSHTRDYAKATAEPVLTDLDIH